MSLPGGKITTQDIVYREGRTKLFRFSRCFVIVCIVIVCSSLLFIFVYCSFLVINEVMVLFDYYSKLPVLGSG